MNHLNWSKDQYAGIGEKLLTQREQNIVLYLNYNTGRRISANGKTLAWQLDDLLRKHPRITSLDLIGHSMGGLVLRSALFYGKQDMHDWLAKVEHLVCIGSPHHGAVLERLGFMLQDRLGRMPLLNRLGRLTHIRSDGILDLRYGSVRDDDWEYLDVRTGSIDDVRRPAPLPSRIKAYMVAGSIELKPQQFKALELVGDYLVSVASALGEHSDPKLDLKVPEGHKAIFYGLNHMEIQYHPSVSEQIAKWLYSKDTQSQVKVEEVVYQQRAWLKASDMKLDGIVET